MQFFDSNFDDFSIETVETGTGLTAALATEGVKESMQELNDAFISLLCALGEGRWLASASCLRFSL